MRQFVTVVLLFALNACANKKGETATLIDADKFERIYLELLDSAQVVQANPDSTLSPVAARILSRYEVTSDQFRATVQEYNRNTQRWKEFYDSVLRRIDERTRRVPAP